MTREASDREGGVPEPVCHRCGWRTYAYEAVCHVCGWGRWGGSHNHGWFESWADITGWSA